ncbi:MAG: hypothetical protein ABSA68_02165 [Xanthobacteraceae bacterium]|jgi:hypothetical protein
MMCIACEQDAMWFAYLQRKGLITPDGYLVEEPPFLAGSIEPSPALEEKKKEENARDPAQKDLFSCDDPTAG